MKNLLKDYQVLNISYIDFEKFKSPNQRKEFIKEYIKIGDKTIFMLKASLTHQI